MHGKRLACLAFVVVLAGSMAALAAPAFAAGSLTGAGSTLVAPLEAEWAQAFQARTGNTVSYNPVGSGPGIADISNRLVDFGASDAPLNPTQAAGCHGCYQIPWALSATGVGFHLNGVHRLRLTGSVLAAIYLGQITYWHDSRIKALNTGTRLPNLSITPVHRSDGSGEVQAPRWPDSVWHSHRVRPPTPSTSVRAPFTASVTWLRKARSRRPRTWAEKLKLQLPRG